MDLLKIEAAANAQNGIMMNEVIRQNNLGPSGATRSGLKLKITQAIIDNMKAALPASAQDDASFSIADQLNQEIPVPNFIYNASSNANFDYMVTMVSEGVGTFTFFWKSDYSRTAMKFDGQGMVVTMAYDGATNSAYVNFTGSYPFTMTAVADPSTKVTHGVFLKQSNGSNYSMKAFADDTGGEVIDTFPGFTYTEDFSATGSLTYQKVNTNTADGTITQAYADKLAAIPASFGAAEGLFN